MTNPENALKIFEHEDFGQVRILDQGGEPWFVAKDVAGILGYALPAKMYTRLDNDEKLTFQDGSSGQSREMIIINESGLYNAIIGSHKPEAKAFKKWVTSEVLPSIRKTGSYKTAHAELEQLSDPRFLAQKILALCDERDALATAKAESDERIARLSHVNKTYTATEMAKEMGIRSANVLNEKLHKLGFQYKRGGTWLPYFQHAELGYVDIKQEVLNNGIVKYHRKFTQKGREYLLDILSEKHDKSITIA